jgi:RNA polymerase sigma-70 factor, ECF subfamily
MRGFRLPSISSLLGLSDEQAMWRVQTADDPGAFAQLVERWEEPIRQLCARMLGDAHRGEDLAQDTFRRLFLKRKEYRANARLSTYLWRIALNLCYDELRRTQTRRESPFEYPNGEDASECHPDGRPDPAELMADKEEGELVRQALMQLPEIYRTVVVLRHYEGLKLREIAEVLEVPEGTVNSRMAKALEQLSRKLGSHFAGRQSPEAVEPNSLHTLTAYEPPKS